MSHCHSTELDLMYDLFANLTGRTGAQHSAGALLPELSEMEPRVFLVGVVTPCVDGCDESIMTTGDETSASG